MKIEELGIRFEVVKSVQNWFFKEERNIASSCLLLVNQALYILPQKALDLREVNLDFYLLDGILEDGLHGLLVHLPLFPDLEELSLEVT